ncbi:MAG: hypothetical protein Q7K26_00635 [bacterium]|nr:hypothetical protein [bacterium]
MANAKLHLICGNCGCNNMWAYRIDQSGHDIEGQLRPAVFLSCGNCATLHDLADTATEQPQDETTSARGNRYGGHSRY